MVSTLYDELACRVQDFRGGRVKDFYHQWTCITSDPEILETVSGLSINLTGELPHCKAFQYPLGEEEQQFVRLEVKRLLTKKIIVKCDHEKGELISPIFLREKSDGDGFRMILNLKKLNEVSEYEHFKMDTLKTALNLIYPGVYMAKLDIKDAYYSVPIKCKDQKLLKFMHEGSLYKFVALPNGYTKGPRKFTKLLKPILAFLRKQHITLLAYLDDILVLGRTRNECRRKIIKVLRTLQDFGFVIHPSKSLLEPSTCMEFLGFIIDSIAMKVTLPVEKKIKLRDLCREAVSKNEIACVHHKDRNTIRSIARLLGKISSSFIAVSEGKMHYRKLEKAKTLALIWQRGRYDKPIALHRGALLDIQWWYDNILDAWAPIIRDNPEIVFTTDASLSGWGATRDVFRTGGLFSEEDKFCNDEETHINILEAKAVLFALLALGYDIRDEHILVLSDNTATVGALNKMGSSKSWGLDHIITQVWQWALDRDIWITASYIPGVLNVEADEESRKSETRTEWMLNRCIFTKILKDLDFVPSIDLFASRINNQLRRFASFRPDPDAEIIDAFTVSWANMQFYAFPPFICIARVLQKIRLEEAMGIVVVPDWPNQPWYNTYLDMKLIEVILPPRYDLLQLPSDSSQTHPLHKSLQLRVGLLTGTDLSPTQLPQV